MKLIDKYKTFILFTILLSLAIIEAGAQKTFNNSVKLHSGGFHFKGQVNSNKQTSLLGAYYERKVLSNLAIAVGHSWWRNIGGGTPATLDETESSLDTARGTIIERAGYKMADITAFYRLNLYKEKHFLKAGLGLSYCWGQNTYIERRYWVFEHGWTGSNYRRVDGYYGIVPQLTYDYNFLRGRINVGLDVRGRYYFDLPRIQYDLGLHAGVNF